MKKKVLVTGGLGFIGYNLVKQLLETSNYEITVIDNLSSDSSSLENKHKNVTYIIDDINNIDINIFSFFSKFSVKHRIISFNFLRLY